MIKFFKNLKKRRKKIWDIQKNIEVDVKWDQKKEELEKEIRRNNFFFSGKY